RAAGYTIKAASAKVGITGSAYYKARLRIESPGEFPPSPKGRWSKANEASVAEVDRLVGAGRSLEDASALMRLSVTGYHNFKQAQADSTGRQRPDLRIVESK